MAKEKKRNKEKVVEAEFEISMHCNGCERTVAKAISKIKGVDTFTTDMRAHRVRIKGKINPEKVSKKLMKKMGKKVEVIDKNDSNDTDEKNDDTGENEKDKDDSAKNGDGSGSGVCLQDVTMVDSNAFESSILTMFSDENSNACLIM